MAEKEGPIHDAVAHVKWFFCFGSTDFPLVLHRWLPTQPDQLKPTLNPPTALGMTGRTGTTDVDRVGFFKFIPSTVNLTPTRPATAPIQSKAHTTIQTLLILKVVVKSTP